MKPVTLCPIALVISCKNCPAFPACPLRTVIGDHRPKAKRGSKAKSGKRKKKKV